MYLGVGTAHVDFLVSRRFGDIRGISVTLTCGIRRLLIRSLFAVVVLCVYFILYNRRVSHFVVAPYPLMMMMSAAFSSAASGCTFS